MSEHGTQGYLAGLLRAVREAPDERAREDAICLISDDDLGIVQRICELVPEEEIRRLEAEPARKLW